MRRLIGDVMAKGAALLLALPTVLSAADVRVEKDVAYLGEGRAEKLDLYLPPDHRPGEGDPKPAIVIIHGGGWFGGDKGAKREINIGTNLARAGYVCASINYELAKASKEDSFEVRLERIWPRNLADCQTAVRYLRSRAMELGIDPKRIGAIGGSAGGHLTAMLGYADEPAGPAEGRLYAEHSSRVQAIVPMYGPSDLVRRARELGLEGDPKALELCRLASPVTHLTPDDPPTLILHGTKDTTVDLEQSRILAKACREIGHEFELKIVEGGRHSFHLQPPGHDLRPLVTRFFNRHLGKKRLSSIPRELRKERFEIGGRPAFIIWPTKRLEGRIPWVLYAPTFEERLPGHAEGWMLKQFLDAGIAMAGVDVGESYGNPEGRGIYTALHRRLVEEHGFADKAILLARSRGGLMLYNWAAGNAGKVAGIAGVYPVCNVASYPGLKRACGAYGMTEAELRENLPQHNPVDRLESLADAGVPIFHLHGNKDKVVPLDANSALLKKRYQALGGKMTLKIADGQWHNMWPGFFQDQDLTDFVIDAAVKAR
jgi:acetyl esterase/lipase